MNRSLAAGATLTITLAAGFSLAGRSDPAPDPSVGAAGGIAVVELFTSEGCSSCPPADKALADLVERSQKEGTAVYALSFHVDYWNRLGWTDPFSATAWSERQRVYSTRTGDNVYTPQCVVNGTRSFVGSSVDELNSAVGTALSAAAIVTIGATVHRTTDGLQVNYTLTGALKNAELNVAVVENTPAAEVRAGENKGRHLAHTHVVRSMRTFALSNASANGSITISMDGVTDPMHAQVILFVQERGQGAVLGAARVGLPRVKG